jgi:Taurine catabolism dioxygenase TauD, TfdA family
MTITEPITPARGPAVWRGAEIADSPGWRVPLTGEHRAEVLAAVRGASGALPGELSTDDFPLPTLGPVLAALSREVRHGRGFALLRGVPVAGLAERDADLTAVGLALHVGGLAPQGPDGARLTHVRDRGVDPTAPTSRSYQHRGRLGYHADPTDAVALLCLRPARSGGLSTIVSSPALHNEVVRTRPDLAAVLYEPWWYDLRSGDGPDSFARKAVYSRRGDGSLSTFYGPDYLRSALRGAHVPPFTLAQEEALELLDRLTGDPRFVLPMDLRPGDFQVLNNHVVLHSRTEYADHPEPHRRRDLIRLWLTD